MTVPERLQRSHPALFCAFAGLASFSAYFAMYAFRRPFAAATFAHVGPWHLPVDYKTALIVAQVIGYALSKIMGVKLISELGNRHRALATLGLIGFAWLALVLFALTPAPWNVIWLFFNGLPLGLIWGLVYAYVEGRRTSEAIGAILCASFILSSGVVKSVGSLLMQDWGISEFWMPAATGAVFFPMLLVSVYGLTLLPPPDVGDRAERTARAPMNAAQRGSFFRRHAGALIPLIAAYVFLTALRDFRDNFAAEIWTAMGYTDVAVLFTASEIPVALLSLLTIGALMIVRDNVRAVLTVHVIIGVAAVLIGGATVAHHLGVLGPAGWMILVGAGLYMAYTPFNAILFDRIIAATREPGTAGFLIYLADSFGYAGSVALLLFRDFFTIRVDWLGFFEMVCYGTAALCIAGSLISALHFVRLRPALPAPVPA